MKFKMDLGKIKTIILAAVAISCVVAAVFDIVLLVGAGNLKTSNPVVVGVSLAAVCLVAFFALMLIFNSFYKFDEEALVVAMGFFVSRIRYDSIASVSQNSLTHAVSLIVTLDGTADELVLGADTTAVPLNLRAEESDKFLDELRKHSDAVIEIFTPEKENKEGK